MRNKICERCKKEYIPSKHQFCKQKYCGSTKEKIGCSYIVRLENKIDVLRFNLSVK